MKDNIKAFPSSIVSPDNSFEPEYRKGMDLRDYFAAKAINQLLKSAIDNQLAMSSILDISQDAYAIADEMIKQREL